MGTIPRRYSTGNWIFHGTSIRPDEMSIRSHGISHAMSRFSWDDPIGFYRDVPRSHGIDRELTWSRTGVARRWSMVTSSCTPNVLPRTTITTSLQQHTVGDRLQTGVVETKFLTPLYRPCWKCTFPFPGRGFHFCVSLYAAGGTACAGLNHVCSLGISSLVNRVESRRVSGGICV